MRVPVKRSVQCLLLFGLFTLFFSAQASAVSNNLVIAQVQGGAVSGQAAAPTQEFVSIYNNGIQNVDVTNWCVKNKDKAFACLIPKASNQTLFLPSHTYMVFVSDNFLLQHSGYHADVVFPTLNTTSGSITAGTDSITLSNAQDKEVDSLTWSSSLAGGMVFQRRMAADSVTMLDTDLLGDFTKVQGVTLPVSGVYEVVVVIDECANLPGLQESVPVGYLKDERGDCIIDACSNLQGLQAAIPEEYVRRDNNDCAYDYVKLQITELLPNVAGSDVGHEYVELYNPSKRDAFLINYALKIGDKVYTFPAGLKLAAGQYMAFYNNEIAFTLLNTTSFAQLLGDDGTVISQSDAYNNPEDDMAWALIDETWQYTNQLTFAGMNAASVFETESAEEATGPAPCAANQYRHPETNRCRQLVTVTATVAPCKDGQYRSEETNRCRMIALAGGTLAPCKENQYRSEETNRCRGIATLASTLTPCKDNQYRSEETNRCRTIAAAGAPAAAFAVEPIVDTDTTFAGWWALGGIGVVALSYAVWEWHFELLSAVRRALSFFTQR